MTGTGLIEAAEARLGDAAPPRRSREPLAFAGLCAGSVAFSLWSIWRASFRVGGWLTFALWDDAMISMRYGRNLAAGDGLVWNAGGERVEGVTNPLWTVWMGALHLLPVHSLKISLLVMLSGAAAVVATLWVVRRLAQELAPGDDAVAVAAVAVAATFFPLAFWSVSGMEVGALAWLVGVVVLYAVRLSHLGAGDPAGRRRILWVLGAAGVAAVALRLDAVVPVALAAAWCGWRAPGGDRWRARWRTLALAGGPPLAALVAMTALRRAYYGDWLPNTYYLKTTGTPLGERLGAGLYAFDHTLLAGLGFVVLAALWSLRGRGSAARWLLAGLVVGQSAYSVWVGGDAWELLLFANRYLTVAVVPLAVLAGLGVRRLAASPRELAAFGLLAGVLAVGRWFRFEQAPGGGHLASTRAVLVLGVVVAAAGVGAAAGARRRRLRVGPGARVGAALVAVIVLGNLHAVVNWWRAPMVAEVSLAREGWAIEQATEPDTVIAVWIAGAEPYFADRPAVDLYGKSDRHIAHLPQVTDEFRPGHTKYDLAWSLRTYRPDLVQTPAGFYDDDAVVAVLEGRGYERLAGALWVRHDSTNVDRPALRRALAAAARP
jgi:arabinofuranosyltransferase